MIRRLLPLGTEVHMAARFVATCTQNSARHVKVVVVGAGAGGVGVIGLLARAGIKNVTLIEPSEVHYYQPYWTLVGAGHKVKEQSAQPMESMVLNHVTWLKEAAMTFNPEENIVFTNKGTEVNYDYLVVCPGIQINWNKIPGLSEALIHQGSGVVSIYNGDYAVSTWAAISTFTGKRAFFTFPNTPIKCAGAPQKIMWLFEDHLRRNGKRNGVDIRYWVPGTAIFGVKRYADMLEKIRKERNVSLETKRDLVQVDAVTKTATFKDLETGTLVHERFDLLHVAPPMSSPDFIRTSHLADTAGWVDVDQHTLQHTKYPNVFALGDCTNTPNSKTAAAITAQAPVLVHNLQRAMEKQPLDGKYNGYSSCPIAVQYGKVLLAEFGYDGKIMETFEPGTGKFPLTLLGQHGPLQHRLFWWFKETGFPLAYWNFWPRGLWYGTSGPFKPDVTHL